MSTWSPATEVDAFTAECREAFTRLALEHAALNPNEPTKRRENQRARLRKHIAIDAVLDQLADHRELAAEIDALEALQ